MAEDEFGLESGKYYTINSKGYRTNTGCFFTKNFLTIPANAMYVSPEFHKKLDSVQLAFGAIDRDGNPWRLRIPTDNYLVEKEVVHCAYPAVISPIINQEHTALVQAFLLKWRQLLSNENVSREYGEFVSLVADYRLVSEYEGEIARVQRQLKSLTKQKKVHSDNIRKAQLSNDPSLRNAVAVHALEGIL